METIERVGRIGNHRGEWCEKINQTCQEGYCDCCEIIISEQKEE